jgi:arylsulfatase A-like enzyme
MTQPNIVVILVDDMGYSDIGAFGSEIRTPNLDSMSSGGMRFSQAYNYGRCCPSRACLLTGMYPHQAGVGWMVNNRGTTAYQGYLRPDTPTIAEVLKTAGYRTYLSGKWHVGGNFMRSDPSDWRIGDPERPLPLDRGFNDWYGTPAGAGSYFNPKPLFNGYDILPEVGEDYYYTDAVTDNAVRMIEDAASRKDPFFLYVAYTAPHWPLHAHEDDIAHYQGKYSQGWDVLRANRHEELKGLGILDSRWPISSRDENAPPWDDMPDKEWQDRRMAVYAAQIECLDRGVGQINDKLRELGLEDNTLVIFLSDNGGCAEFLNEDGQRSREWKLTTDGREVRFGNTPEIDPGAPDTYQSYGLPWSNASNSPFRLFKSWVHEGGISTPMIARWPDAIPAGQINHDVVHIVDFMATFADMAGATFPAEFNGAATRPLEGESLLPSLRGEEWQRERPLFWEHQGNRAVRDGRWKLVSQHPGEWELYDMAEDRTELNDLAEKDKPRAEKMAAEWEGWAEKVDVRPWEDVRPSRLGGKR